MQPLCANRHDDAHYLQQALQQAERAAALGEVPVGAVVISAEGEIIGQGHNRTITDHDPSAHAEMLALRAAAHAMGNHRLQGCTLYVTLEPCPMCSGALLHARLARVVYAVADPKTGAAGSVLNLFAKKDLNHQTVCELFTPQDAEGEDVRDACSQILQAFFRQRRAEQERQRQQPAHAPLRDDALRVPQSRFMQIPALQALQPWSQFVLLADPDSKETTPWRMHVTDTAPGEIHKPVLLLLHGYASYGLLWAPIIPMLHKAGWRVLVPDLLGHGQSDKPKKTQRHSLALHSHLLHQWLQHADFAQHAHRAVWMHDTAALLLAELVAAASLTHAIWLRPEVDAAWRQACQMRPGFDLDGHWALDAQEAASGAWSAPWPDAGHRAALRWEQWAENPMQTSLHGTITAAQLDNYHVIQTPSEGAAFRRWLQQNAQHVLATCPPAS